MTTKVNCYKPWLSKYKLWLCNVNTVLKVQVSQAPICQKTGYAMSCGALMSLLTLKSRGQENWAPRLKKKRTDMQWTPGFTALCFLSFLWWTDKSSCKWKRQNSIQNITGNHILTIRKKYFLQFFFFF